MTTKEQEALQDITDRLHLLLESVNFAGTTALHDELDAIAVDLDALLTKANATGGS